MDYKETLNLPKTDFPMKANLSQRELIILKKWQDLGLYEKLREKGQGKQKFILHDGPIYANGHIHVGHAVNRILKDIIVKAKTLSGFDSPFVPGWDCHGLPIELNVEKKYGKPGHKISATEFRAACRAYAISQINIQRDEFIRLGVVGDWQRPYATMDFNYEAGIIRSFAKIIERKFLQRGHRPIYWCLDCTSALAEAEVEYAEKKSPSIDVRFLVTDIDQFAARIPELKPGNGTISVPIWTTTPWTLPGNQAVALNPYLEYVLIQSHDEQLLVAFDLLPSLLDRYQIKNHQILGRITGEKLEGIQLKHPLFEKLVPIVLGEHVTVEAGTGAVHTAPAHGVDDYRVAKAYQLPCDNPVGDDGRYISTVPLFAGMHVNQANEKVIAGLGERGALIHQETIMHSYPHCWRHKTPIIYRATPQWFISLEQNNLRGSALDAVARVDWIPEWGEFRISGMIETRPDWCISRQRAWGVPLALFVHKETGECHPDTLSLMEKVAVLVSQKGIEAWYELSPKDLLGDEADQYQKTNDVLDVWFDSGVSHECVLKVNKALAFPADLILEGSDQHRGWFQSSLLTSECINETAPYKTVLTHGFVVDAEGRKMSKSIGNVIAPDEVVRTLGADILRLWVASVDYRTEITASKEILSRTAETYRRIRNTARFLLANLHDFDPTKDMVDAESMLLLDRWVVDKARIVQDEILQCYDSYQFHQVIQKLHNFCILDLGGFYLDIIKDRQYTMPTNHLGRRSAQTALYHIAEALIRWMAPILTFTAEEIWEYLPGKPTDTILLTEWYDKLVKLPKDDVMDQAYWEKIREVRDAVNKEIENQRNLGKLGSALEAEVTLYCGPHIKQQLDALEDELRFVLITSSAKVIPEHSGPIDVVVTDVPGLSLKIEPTKQLKCERCWHREVLVNSNPEYPGLCERCVINIAGSGEVRHYA
jgi:isoleucyl-tRNA synthetase